MDSFSEKRLSVNRLRDALVDNGYYEAVTYSFVSPELQALLDRSKAMGKEHMFDEVLIPEETVVEMVKGSKRRIGF